MPTFTLPLKRVLDFEKDPGTGLLIGLGDYPIFDEDHRVVLNRKIINHYWNREIGLETISMFVFAVQRRMNEIMPLYNQVYESQLLEFEAISNYKITTKRTDKTTEIGSQDSNTDSVADSASGSRGVGSTLPQTMLAGNKNYASSGNDATSTGHSKTDTTVNANSTGETNLDGESTTTGYQGSPADLLLKFRATILNTDMLVVGELEDCFMGIWDNGDEMLPQIGMGYYR